jgi:hypothetical protein
LSCGRAPWAPRRLDGTAIVTWLAKTTYFDQPLSALPSSSARLTANLQTTGARGGHDLHYRTLQGLGVPLLGHLSAIDGHHAQFADDVGKSVAFGDARWADARRLLTEQLPRLGLQVPQLPVPASFRYRPIRELDLRTFGAVIYTAGFRTNYQWIDAPVTDKFGFPHTTDGASTVLPGLYFCGVHSSASDARHCCSASAKTPHSSPATSPPTNPDKCADRYRPHLATDSQPAQHAKRQPRRTEVGGVVVLGRAGGLTQQQLVTDCPTR